MRAGDVVTTSKKVWASRRVTRQELREWEEGPDSKGTDDAGETKLPPRSKSYLIPRDTPLIVTRARVPVKEMGPGAVECQLPDGRVLFFKKRDLA